ncbi:hypothetical protein YPPY91_4890, partial [Yersinia pestis PY-91]
MARRTAG